MEAKMITDFSMLTNIANSINAREAMPNSRWKIADEIVCNPQDRTQFRVTRNRTTAIQVGTEGETTDLRTLLESVFAGIVGTESYRRDAMYYSSGKSSKSVFEEVAGFIDAGKGDKRWALMLYGTPGTGKTCLMNALIRTIRFLYAREIESGSLKMCKEKASRLGYVMRDGKEAYESLCGCTVLFLDDIGFGGEAEMVNDYGTKRYPIEEIIERRYDRQLTTICTSNLNRQMLRKHYGEKVYSRMCEMFKFIPMAGEDNRQLR